MKTVLKVEDVGFRFSEAYETARFHEAETSSMATASCLCLAVKREAAATALPSATAVKSASLAVSSFPAASAPPASPAARNAVCNWLAVLTCDRSRNILNSSFPAATRHPYPKLTACACSNTVNDTWSRTGETTGQPLTCQQN